MAQQPNPYIPEQTLTVGVVGPRWLTDQHYYAGKCRNHVVMRWDAKTRLFYGMREKFGHKFLVTLHHMEEEPTTRIDAFQPVYDLGNDLGANEIKIDQTLGYTGGA